MYPSSLFFEVPSSAFVSLSCLNLFFGVVTTITSFVLPLFNEEVNICSCHLTQCHSLAVAQDLDYAGSIVSNVFLIFPHYCLGMGLIDMAAAYYRNLQFDSLGT